MFTYSHSVILISSSVAVAVSSGYAVAMQRKHGGYAGIQSFFAFLPKNISVEIFFMPQNKVPRVGASPQKRVVVLKVLGPPIISSS